MNSPKGILWKTARVCAAGALLTSIIFSCWMAIEGYTASQVTGAAAAQGDLGFFMFLLVVSPVILGLTALSWWIDRLAMRALCTVESSSRLVLALCIFSILALAWNWFYLKFLWNR